METPAEFNLCLDLKQSFISLFCFWGPGSLLKERLPSLRFQVMELRKLNEDSAGCTLYLPAAHKNTSSVMEIRAAQSAISQGNYLLIVMLLRNIV